jgi:hypothetical protein
MVDAVRSNKDAKDPTAQAALIKDIESYSYYLSALVEKKKLLSVFGGDSVRGITAQQRIENTSSRVGLKLPPQSFKSADGEALKLRPGGEHFNNLTPTRFLSLISPSLSLSPSLPLSLSPSLAPPSPSRSFVLLL